MMMAGMAREDVWNSVTSIIAQYLQIWADGAGDETHGREHLDAVIAERQNEIDQTITPKPDDNRRRWWTRKYSPR
jgi:hypothetical protein